ncbi:MAG: carboxypeptidase-like regulatory domain-containing protein [Bacteroidota bacterium]
MKLFSCFLLLIPFSAFSQIESVLIDEKTEKPIPYASIYIKKSKTGTSSDLEGKFSISLDSLDTLMISSVGFKTLELPFFEINDTIKMVYDFQQMSEIVVRPVREKSSWFPKKTILGKVGRPLFTINTWYGSGGNPAQIARFFEFKHEYFYTPYIKKITFSTLGRVKESIFSVKLYQVDRNGLPGKLINSKLIIGKAKKKGHKTSVNMEDQLIRFPKEGLFVAIDYINIESNRSLKDIDNSFLYNDYKYEYSPSIGLIDSENFEFYQYDYKKGKWYLSQDFRQKIECEIILVE